MPQAFVCWSKSLHESCHKMRCILDLCSSFTKCWAMSAWNSFSLPRIQRCVWKEKCRHLAQALALQLHHWYCGRSTTSIQTHLYFVAKQTCSVSWISQWKPWERVHSTFKVSNRCPYPFCQKEKCFFANVCWLSWIESTHHQELVPFALDLRFVGLA